jgi:hypothetical protein
MLLAGCSGNAGPKVKAIVSATVPAAVSSTALAASSRAPTATGGTVSAPAESTPAANAEAFVASQGNLHVNPGQIHAAYSTDPPTSGAHFPTVPQRGIYTQPFVTEYLPHFLEHGGVDVTYNSSASPAVVQKLTDIVKADLDQNSGTDIGQVTLSPRPDMPCMVAVTSWQRIETWGTAAACKAQPGDTGHEFDPNNKADISALTTFVQRNQCQYDPENQCGKGPHGQTIYPTLTPGQPTVIASLGNATAVSVSPPRGTPTTSSGGR